MIEKLACVLAFFGGALGIGQTPAQTPKPMIGVCGADATPAVMADAKASGQDGVLLYILQGATTELLHELTESGKFRAIARDDLPKVLEEQRLTEWSSAVGKGADAFGTAPCDYLLVATVTHLTSSPLARKFPGLSVEDAGWTMELEAVVRLIDKSTGAVARTAKVVIPAVEKMAQVRVESAEGTRLGFRDELKGLFKTDFAARAAAGLAKSADALSPAPANRPDAPGATPPTAANPSGAPIRTAIFVRAAKPELQAHVGELEDFLVATATSPRLSIVSTADCMRAVGTSDLSRLFNDSTSVVTAGGVLGADLLLIASITGLSEEKSAARGPNLPELVKHTMFVTFKVCDASRGGTLASKIQTVSRARTGDVSGDPALDMLREAAEGIGAKLQEVSLAMPPAAPRTPIRIDATLEQLVVPEVVINEKTEYVVASRTFPLSAAGVNVSVDGIFVGTAPVELKLTETPHRIRFERDGIAPHEVFADPKTNATLTYSLRLTDSELARWREQGEFLNTLKAGTKLNDAQVKKLQGLAEYLGNSRYQVAIGPDTDTARSAWHNVARL